MNERLSWLIAVNTYEAEQRRLYRTASEEEEMRLMQLPLPTRQAFSLFGLLLGILVPAAIFLKIFGYGFSRHIGNTPVMFLICVAMNTACAIFGHRMGGLLSKGINEYERASWTKMLLYSMLIGTCWGAATGAIGGLAFFGIGAIFGAFCAVPVAMIAFPLFTSLHRLLARGGMIDARHFWPLVFGVTMTIAMFILGM
ncbi:MAG: hypothetical protein AUG51_11035 [Acidobacteria bacterium 13_1_20CM_3_53_8]|nr:MAG: hypothetical protein AUG51_11035 [Acidobacteria bacterium 13_1_20CM_3_53_8]